MRRAGNSLGIIFPKATLETWKLGEGDHLELTARNIHPAGSRISSHEILDEEPKRML
jgi:antitoxin component of MazEF toxin-antitoxin module